VWTYILRRLLLMIPTLFGVTIVSFCIMQLAPGDPLLNQLGSGGMAGQSSQTREAFLLQKRDLHLDKPLVLNLHYFRDYRQPVNIAAWFLSRSDAQLQAELAELAQDPKDPAQRQRLHFLRKLEIPDFARRLADPQQRASLAAAARALVQVYCEDLGEHGVPAAMALLQTPATPLDLRIGAIHALNHMVVDPFVYTYSRTPTEAETARILAAWSRWWELSKGKYPPIDTPHRQELVQRLADLAAEKSRSRLFEELGYLDPKDMGFFAERLLGPSTLEERFVASLALRSYIPYPLQLDLPADASAEMVATVTANWLAHYQPRLAEYHPGLLRKCWYLVSDTQYAHMVWRLVTFNFGRSALKTREPVSQKIWDAVIVSAPLMVMAELVIYLVAVPLGIVCAVHRAGWTDRLVSLGLFLLYSIPPFVAGMLFLLFFCYGDYLRWFPMFGLHSPGAEQLPFWDYALDYLWHAVLPITCLSLFSLAGMAMYSRTSMLDVIRQDYIRTARAKGVAESKVIFKHALRNALIPIVTLFSSFLPAMLGGSVLIEYLFGIPGMGRLSWASIEQKDFPTLMALIYVDAIVVMISILLTDLMYVFVDPRISFGAQGESK